jgi:hypothetical protein
VFGNIVTVPIANADGAEFFGPLQPADANGVMLTPRLFVANRCDDGSRGRNNWPHLAQLARRRRDL